MLIPFGAPAHRWLNINFVNAITDFVRLYSFDLILQHTIRFVSRFVSRFGLQSFLLQAFTSLFHTHQILERIFNQKATPVSSPSF